MRLRRKTKDLIFGIVSVVVLVGLCLGIIGLVKNLKSNDGLKKVNLDWEVGSINNLGKGIEDEGKLYTKDSFNCFGLETHLEFGSTVKYQVYFYNEDDNYINKCTDILEETSDIEVPLEAKKARIVLIPIWNDDVDIDDQKIKFTNKAKFTKQLSVFVAKEQLNDCEVQQNVYGLDVFKDNVDSTSLSEIFTIEDDTLLNESTEYSETDFYRIYLDAQTDGSYKVVQVSKVGLENKNVDYDLVLVAYKTNVNEEHLEILKMICTSKEYDDFVVKKVAITGGYTYYFSTDLEYLNNVLE